LLAHLPEDGCRTFGVSLGLFQLLLKALRKSCGDAAYSTLGSALISYGSAF